MIGRHSVVVSLRTRDYTPSRPLEALQAARLSVQEVQIV